MGDRATACAPSAQFSNHNRHSRSHFFVKNNPTTGTNIRPTKEAFTETNRMDFQTYLNWKKTFAEDHNIDVVAGYDYMKDKNNSIDARVQGAASDKIPTLNVGTSNITNYPTSTRTDEVLISYFGRVNYNFREKYLLSFTMRADGSSKFAAGNRWGYFPAASAGWVVGQGGVLAAKQVRSASLKAAGQLRADGQQRHRALRHLRQLQFARTPYNGNVHHHDRRQCRTAT